MRCECRLTDKNPTSSEGGDPKRDVGGGSSPPQEGAKEDRTLGKSAEEEGDSSTDSSTESKKAAKVEEEQLRKARADEIKKEVLKEHGYVSDDLMTQYSAEYDGIKGDEARKVNKERSREAAEVRDKVESMTEERLRASLGESAADKKKNRKLERNQQRKARKQRKKELTSLSDAVVAEYTKGGNQNAEVIESSQEDESKGIPRDGDPEAANEVMAKGSKEASPVAEKKKSKQDEIMSPESGEERRKAQELIFRILGQAIPPEGAAPQGLGAPVVVVSEDEEDGDNMDLEEEQREIDQLAKQLEERKQKILYLRSFA